jgi:hypothetical protein
MEEHNQVEYDKGKEEGTKFFHKWDNDRYLYANYRDNEELFTFTRIELELFVYEKAKKYSDNESCIQGFFDFIYGSRCCLQLY